MSKSAWYTAIAVDHSDSTAALEALGVLAGPVHRLAWRGEDERGDRRRALAALQRIVAHLSFAHPALCAVLDWWMVSALGERAVANAWEVARQVRAPTGEHLQKVLDCEGDRPLEVLRRPARMKEIARTLSELSDKNPGRVAAAVRILAEAGTECHAVVNAWKNGQPPPEGLRLAGISDDAIEVWAGTSYAGKTVTRGTPVWDYVVRALRERADLVAEALAIWPQKSASIGDLPPDWARDVEEACAPHHALAVALVSDLLPEPPEGRFAVDLARFEEAPGEDCRWAVFALAREAIAARDGAAGPRWFESAERELSSLLAEVDRLDGVPELGAFVAEARQALEQMDVSSAREWLAAAREEHGKARRDAAEEQIRGALRERLGDLAAVGEAPPAEHDDLARLAGEVDAAVAAARQKLQRRLDAAADALAVVRRPGVDDADQAAARAALQKGTLKVLHDAVVRVERRADDAKAADDARLGPELARVRDGLRGRADRAACLAVLDLVAARRDAGLAYRHVLDELRARLEAPAPAAVVDAGPGREAQRIAWVLTGGRASGADTRPRTAVGAVAVCGAADAVARVRAWGVAAPDGRVPEPNEHGRVYFVEGPLVVGPYREDGGHFETEHPGEVVGALPAARFRALFGAVDLDAARFLVPYPPSLEELERVGAELKDELDEAALASWLAQQLDGAPSEERIRHWLRDESAQSIPPRIREQRFERLGVLMGRARELERVKEKAIAVYLSSAEGNLAVASAAEAIAQRDEARLRQAVAARQAALTAELEALEQRRASVADRLAEEEREARRQLDELRAEIADADALLADRKLQLLARIGAGGVGGAPAAPAASARIVTAPIRATACPSTGLPPLRELVAEVARGTWDEDDVANLLVSVLTGRWTLLAGLPGVGKSTFVRSVLARLGHGPGSGRFLELVVRRDWQDDTPLFGFWHPTHHAWEPSSEGFVEHLLRAGDDAANGYGGLYPVLVEELNLASPEYYLARPISALEAGDPTVRLYDPELTPANAARYPSSFTIPDPVRLLATVNVDDTVERLSPRFLSRASVIWVEPREDGPTWRAEDDAPRVFARWDALTAALDGAPAELGDVEKLLRHLVERRLPGAPTARTRAAIARYLGASRGVLDRKHAEDLQILQRVLPPLRGVGPRWRTLLDELAGLLARHGWLLSAARARELRARGEELGDWYDFFHT